MKVFHDPQLEITKFEVEDVITTSGGFGEEGENEGGWG